MYPRCLPSNVGLIRHVSKMNLFEELIDGAMTRDSSNSVSSCPPEASHQVLTQSDLVVVMSDVENMKS